MTSERDFDREAALIEAMIILSVAREQCMNDWRVSCDDYQKVSNAEYYVGRQMDGMQALAVRLTVHKLLGEK